MLPIIPSLNFDYLKEENTNLSTLQIQPSTFHLCWTITIWSICTFPCSKNAGYDVVVWNNEIYGTQRPHELVLVQVTLFLCFLLVLYFFSVHRLRPYFLLLLQNLLKFRYVNHFISCISLIVFFSDNYDRMDDLTSIMYCRVCPLLFVLLWLALDRLSHVLP